MKSELAKPVQLESGEYRVQCLHCMKMFDAQRSDAKTCSPRCRVAYGREKAQFLKSVLAIEIFTHKVLAIAFRYDKSEQVYKALVKLRNSLNIALSMFENNRTDSDKKE